MVNGVLSESVIKSCVPQGSVLGPLLFLIMMADIDKELIHSFLSSFADDTRVGLSVKSVQDVKSLQDDLDRIYKWAEENNMDFNENKFEILRYGLNLLIKSTTKYFSPNGSAIPVKDHVKDLGITMSSDATFTEHISNVCKKARDMCSWILRTFKERSPLLMMTL